MGASWRFGWLLDGRQFRKNAPGYPTMGCNDNGPHLLKDVYYLGEASYFFTTIILFDC